MKLISREVLDKCIIMIIIIIRELGIKELKNPKVGRRLQLPQAVPSSLNCSRDAQVLTFFPFSFLTGTPKP